MLGCALPALGWLLLLLYAALDIIYFLRVPFIVLVGRYLQRRLKPSDTTSIYGLCLSQDVDLLLRHMNNARYLREMDFGRYDYYVRTGLMKHVMHNAVLGACNVRYRRPISIFSFYRLDTKLVWWDDKSVYLEQQFVTPRDGFVRAVAMCKQSIVGVDVPALMRRSVGERPEQPAELLHWLRSMELSSSRLRRSD